jgi:NitT/TauT family transport system ATP-binding protein
MSASALHLQRVSHRFGDVEVLSDLSLEVADGEFVAVVGPSGCGKTTILNLISGALRPTLGQVVARGQARRVYQQDGLFPWLTVEQNIGLGLRQLHDDRERSTELEDLLRLIRLEGFRRHFPHQLSGGMRQRVELARALAGHSDLLLMDEPFSALDYQTRLRMRRELAELLLRRPRTVVFVTHDIEEAAQLADRVVVLTERPSTIRMEHRIGLPRPRALTHPEVVHATDVVLQALGFESDAGELAAPHLEGSELYV